MADLLLKVDPDGNQGTVGLRLLAFDGDFHEQMGDADESRRVLEDLSVYCVVFDVGDAYGVTNNKVVSLHDVPGLSHQDLHHLLVVLNFGVQVLYGAVEHVVGLPETANAEVMQVVVAGVDQRRRFED